MRSSGLGRHSGDARGGAKRDHAPSPISDGEREETGDCWRQRVIEARPNRCRDRADHDDHKSARGERRELRTDAQQPRQNQPGRAEDLHHADESQERHRQRRGARLAFGEEVRPVYDLERADVLLCLDFDGFWSTPPDGD